MKLFPRLLVLVSLAATCLAHANVIQNGSFEEGYTVSSFDGSDAPTDWSFTPASDGGGLLLVGGLGSSNFDLGVSAEDGSSYLAFGALGPALDSISQTLSTTAGASYDFSFWLDTDQSAGPPMQLVAAWGSNTVLNLTAPLSASGWNLYSFSVTGTGSDTVSFSGFDSYGYTLLDNVQVQPIATGDGAPGLLLTIGTVFGLLAFRRLLPA